MLIGTRRIQRTEWVSALPLRRLLMNSQTHTALGTSPFEMVFARRATEYTDIFAPSRVIDVPTLTMGNQRTKESSRDFVDTLQDRLEKIRDEAIRLQESLASKRKKQATSVELNEDDYVWLR
ncbi:hypothetical protein ADUPG1_004620, partial [Aduncisulcus paluster]